MFHSRRIWLIALLFVLLAGSAAYWHLSRQRFADFTVHDRGLMYAAGHLDPAAISDLIEIHQFRTVIQLCEPGTKNDTRWTSERNAVEQAGATFLVEPFADSASASDSSVARQIEILQDPDNYPILVHSSRGVDRTARFLITYDLLFRGMTAGDVLASLPRPNDTSGENKQLADFARDLERRHTELYPTASADNLKILR